VARFSPDLPPTPPTTQPTAPPTATRPPLPQWHPARLATPAEPAPPAGPTAPTEEAHQLTAIMKSKGTKSRPRAQAARAAPSASQPRRGRPPRLSIDGTSLRVRRVAAGLSAEDLRARLVRLGAPFALSTIYQWERREASPDDATVAYLAKALDCRVRDLRRPPRLR